MSKRMTAIPSRRPGAARPQSRTAAAHRLGFLVWDVSRLWRVVIDRALKPLGVTRSQYMVIAFLSRRDGMTQTALAAGLELTKVAVGGLLERMEVADLVERRADDADARVRRVYLTRKGTLITKKIRELADPIEAEMLAPVSDGELDGVIETLETMKRKLLEFGDAEDAAAEPLPKPAGTVTKPRSRA